jgi:hypothetical protein
MGATKQGRGTKEPVSRETVCSPLKHPLRVRILEVVNERDMSPVQFLNEGLAPGFKSRQNALSHVSYHFRQLEKAGCVEIIATFQRRGATEHVYRGKSRVYFTDAEFERLPLRDRSQLSRTSFQGLVARTDGAMAAGTFDGRTDRHLTWVAMDVDQRGWKELGTVLAACFGEVERIRHDARGRLDESDDEVIPATVAILGFESPPLPSA